MNRFRNYSLSIVFLLHRQLFVRRTGLVAIDWEGLPDNPAQSRDLQQIAAPRQRRANDVEEPAKDSP